MYPFFQYGDELREQPRSSDQQKWKFSSEDKKWSMAAYKLAFAEKMRSKMEVDNGNKAESQRYSLSEAGEGGKGGRGIVKQRAAIEEAKHEALNKLLSPDWKFNDAVQKLSFMNSFFSGNGQSQVTVSSDKRFKCLPPSEMLPRSETLGGYIFVCNNDTMQEDLKRQLFGLPQRYRDSVRAIQPGLPLFLYNYTTHQLHGILRPRALGAPTLTLLPGRTRKVKESRGFLPRYAAVCERSVNHWRRMHSGLFYTIMMDPSSDYSSRCLRL